jgi:predicted GTPase
MTTTTAANAQVWLVKEATRLGPFVVWLDGDCVDFGELAPGQWVVVVDTTRALKRVGRIRIPRIRTNLESTTLYFDPCSRA